MRAYEAGESVEVDDHAGRAAAGHAQGRVQDRRTPIERSFLSLVTTGGVSVTRAASQVGVDTQTGILWAGRAGIMVNRRPKKVDTRIRNRIVSALNRGAAKQTVARQHGVSVETITRILLVDPSLHQRWQEQCLKQRRMEARSRWQRAIRRHPGAGIKEIRQFEPAAYIWLYRNDHDWLNAQNTTLCTKVQGITPRSTGHRAIRHLHKRRRRLATNSFVRCRRAVTQTQSDCANGDLASGRRSARWNDCRSRERRCSATYRPANRGVHQHTGAAEGGSNARRTAMAAVSIFHTVIPQQRIDCLWLRRLVGLTDHWC